MAFTDKQVLEQVHQKLKKWEKEKKVDMVDLYTTVQYINWHLDEDKKEE